MGFRGDDRGVTVQVGAVLLFGILIISLSMYQTTVVPDENAQVEYQHNQRVQEDMQSFRSAVTRADGSGSTQSVAVRLGTQFPERSLFVNPPAPSGTLRTTDAADIRIQNAKALDDETADYWSGIADPSDSDAGVFDTNRIRYEPNYRVYQNAPTTVYENGVLYNEFGDTNRVLQSGQSIVDGRRISLVAVDGDLSQSQTGALAVDVRPVSVSERTVTVEGDGGPLVVAIASELDEETWENQLLDSEYDEDGPDSGSDDGRYVVDVTKDGNLVKLTLESGYEYDLNLAKVGVGTGVADTTATYLTGVSGDGETVAEGSTQQVVVEVRDEFNNPVSGQQVEGEVTSGVGSVDDSPATTDEDGRAVFTYSAPPNVGGAQPATVTAKFGEDAEQQVEFDLSVADSDGSGGDGGGGADINPNSDNAVILTDSSIADTCGGSIDCKVDVRLKNLDTENTQSISLARFNFYDVDAQSNGNTRDAPQSVKIVQDDDVVELKSANSGGRYEEVSPTIDIGPGESENLRLEFYEDDGFDTAFNVEKGDFFVFSIVFDNGRSATYFVAPTEGGVSGDGTGSGGTEDESGSASRVEYVIESGLASANGGESSGVQFQFRNTGSESVEATSISITTDDTQVARIEEDNGGEGNGQREVFIDSESNSANAETNNDGYLEVPSYTIGDTASLTESALVPAGNDATVYIYRFEKDNGNSRNMNNDQVTVIINFADGTSKQFQFTASN
jgi:hypothetical protein